MPVNRKKILLIGLDNAGKTTLYLMLSGQKSIDKFTDISPTKHISRNIIKKGNEEYLIWDFGGQKAFIEDYRKTLKKNPFQFLEGATKIIFVIDVQDKKRYGEALDYFKDFIDVIKKHNISIKISIFLHKFDPDIREKAEFGEEILEKEIIGPISEIIGESLEFQVFRTFIQASFNKSPIFL